MRPIPAPRLGDAHGLLRAIGERDRIRLDEFVTEFSVEELFPPGLENALGRTRQFISFARSAGLLNEDRGTVELTEMGKRYVRAGDSARPFDVAPAQAEWLRRLLRERHMTDSIYHGAAVGLSLCASNPPGFHASAIDFGRALNHLGRAGWDSENTFQSQGERYTTFLRDLELVDEERRLTQTGQRARDELTLPIHMSLKDLAGQLNPGGPEAAAREGEAEVAVAQAPPQPAPEPEPVAEPAPAAAPAGEDEYEDVGPGAGPSPAAAPPPTPPADIWESGPADRTQAYRAVGVDTPVPAEAAPAAPTADAPIEGAPSGAAAAAAAPAGSPPPDAAPPAAPSPGASAPPGSPGAAGPFGASPPAAAPAGAPAPPGSAPPGAAPPSGSAPPVGSPPDASPLAPPPAGAPGGSPPAPFEPSPAQGGGPGLEELAGAATVASSAAPPAPAVSAAAIAAAAQDAGLRLPAGVYAAVAAALAGGHVVLVGPAGCGKTTLALAVAKAAAQSGQTGGATLVTASQRWSGRDTLGHPGDEEWERGTVVDAAARGRWLVIDELGRARLDRALGELSSFLGGAPVALPDGESEPPDGWRIVATATAALEGSPALVRRFAHVYVPAPHDTDLALAIGAAAGSDTTAAAAVKRLIGARELGPVGTGAFLDAARFAARRNAAAPADAATLAREALAAHIAPVLGSLGEEARARLWALAG